MFETEDEIGTGRKIELIVHVGDALGGRPVTLHVQGITVRHEKGAVAVAAKKHRLRPLDPKA